MALNFLVTGVKMLKKVMDKKKQKEAAKKFVGGDKEEKRAKISKIMDRDSSYGKKTKVKKRNNDKTLLLENTGPSKQREKLTKSIKKSFKYGLENHVQQSFQIQSSISPSVLDNPYLSAVTLNDFIEDQLRRRIFFKKVFGTIKRDTQKLFRQGHLKGIRILLSGRLGRPEKAKTASLYSFRQVSFLRVP